MHVARGLVIADPWIGYILEGSKTWEMRSRGTSVRGPIGLIRKGTGAIWGIATLSDVGPAFTPAEMLATCEKHRIPDNMIRSGEVAQWSTPWILSDVRRLATPVAYDHPNGAVTWVNLREEVSRSIARQLEEATDAPIRVPGPKPLVQNESDVNREMSTSSGRALGRLIAQIQVTEGNIKNNHFYLRGHIHRFPSDLLGGSNKSGQAAKTAVIDWGGVSPAMCDIDGEKQLFRGRSWVRQFFEATGARPGDSVLVQETAPYLYRVRLKKA
jgi:hypothetical protein